MNATRSQGRKIMTNKPRVVLLMAPEAGYDRDLLCGIGRYAALHGPWVFHLSGAYPGLPLPQKESVSAGAGGKKQGAKVRPRLSLSDLKRWGATGIIGRVQSLEVARQILQMGIPLVAMDRTVEQLASDSPMAEVPEIVPDSHKAGWLAAEHFSGARLSSVRVLWVCGTIMVPTASEGVLRSSSRGVFPLWHL